MAEAPPSLHVSLVAIPDAVVSTLTGIYDVMNSFKMLAGADSAIPDDPPFKVEIVGTTRGTVTLASGMPIATHRGVPEVTTSDIIIVPSILLEKDGWETGRYPELVAWLRARHAGGAILCSACSGLFLLAETGLFDGAETTVHWRYATAFKKAFPLVPVHPDRVLVVSGARQQFVSSGASMTWHDLVLYLIVRYVGATAAQAIARSFALQWHHDGLDALHRLRGAQAARRFRHPRRAGMARDEFLRWQPRR